MAFAPSEAPPAPGQAPPRPVKIIVAGGFAVGKTTFVGSISEIKPLTTEAVMTEASVGVDDAGPGAQKSTTTVAMDFGRITLAEDLRLYLFGTPGQDRFWFMWDDLVRGAIGAVVIVDTRRLADCFRAVDYFESKSIPFIVGVNRFNGVASHRAEAVRDALALSAETPIVYCDARDRESTKQTLIVLLQHLLANAAADAG